MKKKLLSFFVCFLCLPAYAGDLPEWVSETPKPDDQYRYFVGVGSEETRAQAIQSAKSDARDQVLTYLGAEIRSDMFMRETENSLNSDSRVNVSSSVNLKGFDKEKTYCEKENKKHSCYVLMKYPLKELKQERKRLESDLGKEKTFQFNILGNDTRRGTLIIDTGNIQADFYVDGEKMGRTPAKLVGQLEPEREYKIRIDSDAYKIYERKVYIRKNVEEIITPILEPAYAKIAFELEPDVNDAVLKVNDIERKTGKKYELPAGKKIRVEAFHPQYRAVTTEYVFKRDDNKTVLIPMAEDPAVLTLVVSKPEYKIEIDGKVNEARGRERRIKLKSGKHKITVYAENVKPVSETIKLDAAEKRRMVINDDFFSDRNGSGKEKGYRFLPAVFISYGKTGKIGENFNPRKTFANADFSYLVPKLAYDTSSGAVRFIVRVSVDKDEYEKSFVEPLKKTLLKASYSSSKAKQNDLKLRCIKKDDLSYSSCGVGPVKDIASAYVRIGEPVENLFSRKAPFLVIKDVPDWTGGNKKVPVTHLEVFFSLFDQKEKSLASFTVPFVLIPYQVVGNMYVFSPIMALEDDFECDDGDESFYCGTTVLKVATKKVHIDLNDVKDIYISIGASK
ncbi:MAG: PEGA domain-containing protein [Clostridia bacterium]|nr:PEGA domain-containing protein [Clostridia bacterium]